MLLRQKEVAGVHHALRILHGLLRIPGGYGFRLLQLLDNVMLRALALEPAVLLFLIPHAHDQVVACRDLGLRDVIVVLQCILLNFAIHVLLVVAELV